MSKNFVYPIWKTALTRHFKLNWNSEDLSLCYHKRSLVERSSPPYPITYLIFAFKHQDISDLSKGQTQGDDFSLGNLIGEFPDMNDSGWWAVHAVLHPQFLTVTSISCQIIQKHNLKVVYGLYDI